MSSLIAAYEVTVQRFVSISRMDIIWVSMYLLVRISLLRTVLRV